jgi:hypothetical protein
VVAVPVDRIAQIALIEAEEREPVLKEFIRLAKEALAPARRRRIDPADPAAGRLLAEPETGV